MPIARRATNAFTAREVSDITGLSMPMVDYLLRAGFLRPAYDERPGRRGRIRYYSYRDLVAARLVQRLRETGVELQKLKLAIQTLASDEFWADDVHPHAALDWLVSDGREIMIRDRAGFLETLSRRDRQGAFAFVVSIPALTREVRALVPRDKRAGFSMQNSQPVFAARS